MASQIFTYQADICRALAHPKRLEILHLLLDSEKSAGDLALATDQSKANLSQHLAVLKAQELIVARRDGVNLYYRVTNPKIGEACSMMREVLLDRLRDHGELNAVLSLDCVDSLTQ